MAHRKPTPEIKCGRRAIDGLDGCRVLEPLTWLENQKKWHLKLQLTSQGSALIPANSDWHLLIDQNYPWAEIKFYPSNSNSIEITFPHQSNNAPSVKKGLWRLGNPCLDTDVASLNRVDIDTEPMEANKRLLWQVERLKNWLNLASTESLLGKGDPFELPLFPSSVPNKRVVFDEGPNSFAFWSAEYGNSGVSRLFAYRAESGPVRPGINTFFIHGFKTAGGGELKISWGNEVSSRYAEKKSFFAPWVLLPNLPTVVAWQVPRTWKELRGICEAQGIQIANVIYAYLDELRKQRYGLLLFGMAIPRNVGEANCQIHWQAIKLPALSAKDRIPNGYRNNRKGRYAHDMQDLNKIFSGPCEWLMSENWNKGEITTRGSFTSSLQHLKIVMIGCGALGSHVSEVLIRNGVEKMILIDGDFLAIGNLTRHTLDLDSIGLPKTTEVARRLNKAAPHASIEIIAGGFPATNEDGIALLRSCNIVIDCTGSDKLLVDLKELVLPTFLCLERV